LLVSHSDHGRIRVLLHPSLTVKFEVCCNSPTRDANSINAIHFRLSGGNRPERVSKIFARDIEHSVRGNLDGSCSSHLNVCKMLLPSTFARSFDYDERCVRQRRWAIFIANARVRRALCKNVHETGTGRVFLCGRVKRSIVFFGTAKKKRFRY